MLLHKTTSLIVTLSMVLTVTAQAQEFKIGGLQKAIKSALAKNPNIKSHDKDLEADLLNVDAEKKDRLPSVGIGYSFTRDAGASSNSVSASSKPYRDSYRGGSASLDWNIYDGGARKFRIKSMECEFKEKQAYYNSTNTLLRNTQGSVASKVVAYYTSLAEAREDIAFKNRILQILAKIRSVAQTESEISQTENTIEDMKISLRKSMDNERSSAKGYQYVVTEPAPAVIDTFQQMIQSLQIPRNADVAINMANEKSPEIKTARYNVECNELRYQSAKAGVYSPKVNISAGQSFGHRSNDLVNNYQSSSNGTSITASINWRFGAGAKDRLAAQEMGIESAKDNLDGTVADTKYDLESYYPDMRSAQEIADSYAVNLARSEKMVAKYMSDINSNALTANVTDVLKEVNTLMYVRSSYQQEVLSILNYKFKIQKTVGTLFESLGLSENGISKPTLL